MPLPLKDVAKLSQIIIRIQSGTFDANDVDNLLIKLRPYAGKETVFSEVANFVAHSDARHKGLAQQSITGFVDSFQYIQEYVVENRPLNIAGPFPGYIYRLLLSQARLSDERQLRAKYRMGRATLIKKIEAHFSVDKKTGTCSLLGGRIRADLVAAIMDILRVVHSRPAFHIRDFHKGLKNVMRAHAVSFDEMAWSAQIDRLSLAILCLISNTEFLLTGGSRASCILETENHFRLLSGQRRLPSGVMSSEPKSFGRLMVAAEAAVPSSCGPPIRVSFPLIETDLDPHEHCDPCLFHQALMSEDFGECEVEVIDFAPDMLLSGDFKLVRAETAVAFGPEGTA